MPQSLANRKTMLFVMMTVLNVYAQSADGQSYLLTLENVLNRPLQYNLTAVNSTDAELYAEQSDNNTKIIVYKNTVVGKSNELSQTAMDVITIVWYVATFLALAAFFMLMACSDRRCRDMRSQQSPTTTSTEAQRAPPTPSPSYSEFAPPSYDTVIKMQHAAKTSVFVIPFEGQDKANESEREREPTSPPPCNLYAVNEVQKPS